MQSLAALGFARSIDLFDLCFVRFDYSRGQQGVSCSEPTLCRLDWPELARGLLDPGLSPGALSWALFVSMRLAGSSQGIS